MKNPVRASCMIQEGQLTDAQVRHLEAQLVATYRAHFGAQWQVRVVWLSLPPGQAFVEGRPSRSSTIQIAVPDGTDDDKRHAFMRDASRFWLDYTGCTKDELVLSVPDESYALEFLKANMGRFDPARLRGLRLRMLWHGLRSRLTRGYTTLSFNFTSAR